MMVVMHHLGVLITEETTLISHGQELKALLYGFGVVIVHHQSLRWRSLTSGHGEREVGRFVNIEVEEVWGWSVRAGGRHAW